MNTDLRLPPHSVEAEACAVASAILDADIGAEVATILRPEDFYLADHAIMFRHVSLLRRDGQNVDAFLLREELKKSGELEAIGGTATIAKILATVPSAAHGPAYAKEVKRLSALRQIISAATKAQRLAYENETEPEKLASDVMNDMLALAATGAVDRIIPIADAMRDLQNDIEDRSVVRRLLTNFSPIDEMIGGLPVGKFVIIGGRPGMGKSLVGKNLALYMAKLGTHVGIVSIEEDRQKIAENAAAFASGVDNRSINQNRFEGRDGEMKRRMVLDAIKDVEQLPIFIADEPVKIEDVEAAVTAMKIRHGCEAVFVDHIHIIGTNEENAVREVTLISRTLKALAKRLRIVLVAMAQLNRGSEHTKEKPRLKDLRDSGSLEQDADLVIFCYREDYYNKHTVNYVPTNTLELIFEKNKDGVTGVLPIKVSLPHQRIEPMEADYNSL